MNYEIHIQDADNLEDPLILEYAERDSISVQWLGGDDPTQPIVPSLCRFSLETLDGRDGKYIQYFTSNEKKWRVRKVISDTQEVIGEWYILPETFDEPYLNPAFYTSIEAVDGLGLLKGRELPADFYKEEKSVIEILSECLQLTQIDFDIFLAPAFHNRANQNWKDIFLDTEKYYDEDKPPSAYVFLEELVSSMQCQLFQCDARWYIEGINRRHIPKVTFYKYSITGAYLGTQDVNKNIKETSHFLNADISMLPALGKITVSHEATEIQFPKGLYQPEVDWILPVGTKGEFYPPHWLFTNAYKPKHSPPDNFLELPGNPDYGTEYNRDFKIELRKQPYILKGTRVRIKMSVQVIWKGAASIKGGVHPLQEHYDNGELVDVMVYRITHAGNTIFYNENTSEFDPARLELNAQGAGEVQLDFITLFDGFLNIELWEPKWLELPAHYMQLKQLSIENLNQRDDKVVSLVVDELSSLTEDIELPISDDVTATSKAFQLEKLKPISGRAVQIAVPVLDYQLINGKHYSTVSVEGAALIDLYPDHVIWNSQYYRVDVTAVHFNFNGGHEMLIETPVAYESGSFFVAVAPLKEQTTDRKDWIRWVDSVYGIEEKPIAETVADIHKRMFEKPRVSIRGSIDYPLKFNDLLKFTYLGESRLFSFSDLQWDPDDNSSSFVANEAMYRGAGTGQIPPLVYAGPDVLKAEEGAITVQVTEAEASAPVSNIEGLLWEQISGEGTATFSSNTALLPMISNLTGDEYTFRLTATDSAGLTASDEMKVIRQTVHNAITVLIEDIVTKDKNNQIKKQRYLLSVNPALPAGIPVVFSFKAAMNIVGDVENNYAIAGISVFKNENNIFVLQDNSLLHTITKNEYSDGGSFQFITGNEIIIQFYSSIQDGSTLDISQNFEITEYAIDSGQPHTITGLPLSETFNHTR